jgi:predicted nucleic acid-binding protein
VRFLLISMTLFDSNIWIAYLNKNDSQHKKAVSLFNKLDEELLITEYIILEVATVLAMRVDKKLANNFLEIVLDNTDIQVLTSSGDFFAKTVDYFISYKDNDLSFADVSLLALSRIYDVYTFDKELEKRIN